MLTGQQRTINPLLFLISHPVTSRLVFRFSRELEGRAERGESMRGRGPSLSPSSAPCLYPLVLSLHNGARESHPALSYPCFLFPQLSPLSPHLWPHRNCFLKPPAGTALTRESLVTLGKPSGGGCSCRPVLGIRPASPAPRSAAVAGDSYTPGADRLRIKTLTFSGPPLP